MSWYLIVSSSASTPSQSQCHTRIAETIGLRSPALGIIVRDPRGVSPVEGALLLQQQRKLGADVLHLHSVVRLLPEDLAARGPDDDPMALEAERLHDLLVFRRRRVEVLSANPPQVL